MNPPIYLTKGRERRFTNLMSTILGWLGSANLLLLGSYLFTTTQALSHFPNTEQLRLQGYSGAGLLAVATIATIIGNYLVHKGARRRGGTINLLAGTLISIPVTLFFSLISNPALLEWLGPLAWILLAPTIMSGSITISIPANE